MTLYMAESNCRRILKLGCTINLAQRKRYLHTQRREFSVTGFTICCTMPGDKAAEAILLQFARRCGAKTLGIQRREFFVWTPRLKRLLLPIFRNPEARAELLAQERQEAR